MDMITGKGPSNRHEIWYFGESELGAVRIDDYKYRFIDQLAGWLGEKSKPDVPYLINPFDSDPFRAHRLGSIAGPKTAHNNISTGSNTNSGYALCLFSSKWKGWR